MKTVSISTRSTVLLNSSSPGTTRDRVWATVTASLMLATVAGWLAWEISKGTLAATDELLTAERSREMLLTEPWVVHFNFERSFEKPPLQYWLTSLTLTRFQNPSLAVRIWPLFYGVLTATALGWLVFLIKPNQPWLIPLSVAILISAPLFSTEAARGLLDVGLAFFTTLTVVFAELARKRPAWWLGAAVACWLGSLQKIPIPFLIWFVVVVVRLTNRNERANLRTGSGWLISSLLVAVAAMSIWPLLQLLKYGMPVGSLFHEEVVVWLGPTGLGARPYFEIPLRMVINGGLCGLLMLLGPFLILLSKKERARPAVLEIAIVSLTVIALAIVSNFRHVRYAIPVVPFLCFLLALVFYRFLKQASPVRGGAIIALVVLLLSGFVETKIRIDHLEGKVDRNDRINVLLPFLTVPEDVTDERLIAEKLGTLQREETKTVLVKAINPGADLPWDSFYLFYGKFRFPVANYTVEQIRADPPQPPLVGACVLRDLPVIQEIYPNLQVELTRAQFVCWQVLRQ